MANPQDAAARFSVPALIDSGADQTCIPGDKCRALGPVVKARPIRVIGPTSSKRLVACDVDLLVGGTLFASLEVIVLEHLQYALIGRDILNRYKLILDGPNLEWTVEPAW